jgi:serine/threonine protein kinase
MYTFYTDCVFSQTLATSQKLLQHLPRQLLAFCTHIADAMAYLSGRGFIHRDLAARNILLDKSLNCKVWKYIVA